MDERDKLIKQRKTKITKEFNKLKKIFADESEQRQKLAESILNEMAFIKVQLEELKENILRNGVVAVYRNSATQYGTKRSPALQSYNALAKTYSTMQKLLVNDIFKDLDSEQTDELQKFMSDFEDDT